MVNGTKIVVLGYDAVSPLGTDIDTQWKRAIAGESGIGPLTRFPADERFPIRIAGQVSDIDTREYPFLKPRPLALWPSPVFKYALLTSHRALLNSGIQITPDLASRVAVTYSSAVGGQDMLIRYDRRLVSDGKLPPPYMNPNSCINMVGGKISILTGASGPITSTVSACATGLTSMLIGSMLLATGKADVAISGAVDFALVEPIVAGFATMNAAYVSHPDETVFSPGSASRPFSLNRRGFVISEGAGAFILATEDFAKTHGLKWEIEIAGWSMTADAHHFVSPNFSTIYRCMKESIQDAGISPDDIDAVNAHAASTKIGDKVEYDALKAVFGEGTPPVTANKSLIGHAMGASSAIESIFAIEGMRRAILPQTINYIADPEIELDVVCDGPRKIAQEFVLKNAFGFGGCNACAVFKRVASS